ncbi:MAG: pyridoxal-phosphate-dependent aminotransferase family protein [Acidobacteriota bacterium]
MRKEKLLLIPGPTPVHPRIINSLSLPTVSHVSPEFVKEFKEALINLKNIVFSKRGEPFIVAGAGTLAMEMALLNTAGKNDLILVLSQGYFGERMKDILASFDRKCRILQSEWGRAILPEELEAELKKHHYQVVVSTHVDTATGACAPVRNYAQIIKENDPDILFIVDGVCATGGIEEKMDDWGIDVVLTAAQKCFGAPPGLSVLVLSEKAMKKRKSLTRVPAYYSDLLRWLPVMRYPSKYFSTPCVNEIRAFAEGTRLVLEEGLKNRFKRHARTARAIRAAFQSMGLKTFTSPLFLADTLSVVFYPRGVNDRDFRSLFLQNGVVVAGGLGEIQGKVFRMGHMGNLSESQAIFALEAMEETFLALGYQLNRGAAIQVAKDIFEEKIH